MSQTEASKQADFIIPPVAGQITVLTTGAATSQDLRLVGNLISGNDQEPWTPGIVGHYAAFQADGADVYVKFGPTAASVTTTNAPVSTATGINAAGACIRIPDGAILQVKLRLKTPSNVAGDLFVGFMSGSAGRLRIWQAST